MSKKALITGASSGLGVVFAHELAAEGYSLVLVARREDKLKELKTVIEEKYKAHVEYIVQDVSTIEGVKRICDTVQDVDFLVNNAGYGIFEDFFSIDIEKELNMIDLNAKSLYYLSKVYSKRMSEKKSGGIINIASTAAFTPIPKFTVYAATKAFVLHFSLALSKEVEKHGVKVMALCPGPTTTEFFAVADSQNKFPMNPKMMMNAEAVVRQGLAAFRKGRKYYVPGFTNRLGALVSSWLPKEWILSSVSKMFK